jgi:hypothetical protein
MEWQSLKRQEERKKESCEHKTAKQEVVKGRFKAEEKKRGKYIVTERGGHTPEEKQSLAMYL